MIPKIAACVHAVEHGVRSAHILDGRIPHVLLLELFTDEGIGTMIIEEDVSCELASHADLPAAAGHVRARRGHPAVGHGRQRVPRLPLRSRRHVARTRESRDRRRHRRAGADAAARVQPVRHRARRGRRRHARSTDRRRRRARLLLQLRRGGERVRHQAGAQVRRTRPPRRRQCVRLVPRPHAGDACTRRVSRRSTSRSNRCPRASAMSPGTTSTRSRPRSTRRSPPCCSSRCRAKAA